MPFPFNPNLLRKSGMDDFMDQYQQPEPEADSTDYSYKRGPAMQQYMDYNNSAPDIKGANVWQRIAAGLAGMGPGGAALTAKLLNDPYEKSKSEYHQKGQRLKSAADLEEKESGNKLKSLNYESLDRRRRERGEHEVESESRRFADQQHDNDVQDARLEFDQQRNDEINADRVADNQRAIEAQKALQHRSDRSYSQRERFHSDVQGRMADPIISPAAQAQIDRLAGEAVAAEFPQYFDVKTTPQGKTIRSLKPDVPDSVAAMIEQKHGILKEEIANKHRSAYDVPEPEDKAEEVEEVSMQNKADDEEEEEGDDSDSLGFYDWMKKIGTSKYNPFAGR